MQRNRADYGKECGVAWHLETELHGLLQGYCDQTGDGAGT